MAKVPEPGFVKTRLQPYLSPQQSAELATALLADAEVKAGSVSANTIVAFTPPEKRNYLVTMLHHRHLLIEQEGEDLGSRMHNAFERAFEMGFESVLIIGTDSPTVPESLLPSAYEKLDSGSDAVLGPANDGGFYLIGLNRPDARIFENVEWSSEEVFEQTAANIGRLGLNLGLLPVHTDLDSTKDLIAVRAILAGNPGLSPSTAMWLRRHFEDRP